MANTIFKDKTLLITGGTGSFGHTVLKHFLTTDIGEIRIFSRDEKKQDDMRHELQANYPDYYNKVKFYIGDVRNIQSLRDVMPGVNFIFHAAALKQVPSCEFFPMEAVRTNIEGTDNMLHAAIEAGVERVVCLSTDKAAYPINAMGISKAMMEHVITANARVSAQRGGPVICCTRYGNVMCSRGSVIPLFVEQIKAGNPITITDPNMTRFLMNLDEAVDLVMFAFEHANPGDLFIQKSDASTIGDLAKAVQQLFGDTGTRVIGTRHGEKLYETLMTKEEILAKIATMTGGRAAEEVVFNSITTGASNDIEQATKLARAMITRYGMSKDFDMVALETVTNQYLGGDSSLACSAQTQREIDQKVVELVKAEHAKAIRILTDNRAKLDELAKYLYEKETITGEEFMNILNREDESAAPAEEKIKE